MWMWGLTKNGGKSDQQRLIKNKWRCHIAVSAMEVADVETMHVPDHEGNVWILPLNEAAYR